MKSVELFCTTPRIVFGCGCIKSLGEEVKLLQGKKVFIVTDPGLVKAGIVDILESTLKDSGLAYARFDQVEADPPYELVQQVHVAIKAFGADVVIGFGGGSAQDIAKAAAILCTNEGPIERYFGIDLIPKPGMPVILIPTTAGTGSEVTNIVILSDKNEQLKKGVVSPHLFPNVAILDPELTLGLPPAITAATGMDALIHAVEAYTSVNATPMSDILAKEAIQLIHANLRTAYANGANLAAREAMLRGSLLAGMAFCTAGVTAVHAFAYPIGAEFHIPHGIANTIMFLPVMEFNYIGNMQRFAELAKILGVNTHCLQARDAALQGLELIKVLAKDLQVPCHLADFGVKAEHVPALAKGAMQVTRLLGNNPRKFTLADAEAVFKKAL